MADVKTENNQIPDSLPGKAMRKLMENKALLDKKGDIYVGTGENETVVIGEDSYVIPKTSKLELPLINAIQIKVATVSNLSALSGLLIIDGIQTVTNDLILVKDQTNSTQNGIYVAGSSTWARATAYNTWENFIDVVFKITSGTSNANTYYESIAEEEDQGILGTNNLTFYELSISPSDLIIPRQVIETTNDTSNYPLGLKYSESVDKSDKIKVYQDIGQIAHYMKIRYLSQNDYSNIAIKDPNTLYLIKLS